MPLEKEVGEFASENFAKLLSQCGAPEVERDDGSFYFYFWPKDRSFMATIALVDDNVILGAVNPPENLAVKSTAFKLFDQARAREALTALEEEK